MKTFFIVGEILFVGLIVLAIYFSGNGFGAFIDIPSFIVIIAGVVGMSLMSFSPSEIINAHLHFFSDSGTKEEMELSAYFWLCVIRNLYIVGILATLIGLVGMLQNLSDPNAIGPAMAIALLTFFYAIFFSVMLPIPAYYFISKRIADAVSEEEGV